MVFIAQVLYIRITWSISELLQRKSPERLGLLSSTGNSLQKL